MKDMIIIIIITAFLLSIPYWGCLNYHQDIPTALLIEWENLEFFFPIQKSNDNIVQIKRHHRYQISPGDIISGDILKKNERQWWPLHDKRVETALIVVGVTSDILFAPYGATVYKKESGVTLEALKKEKLNEGFSEVIIKEI